MHETTYRELQKYMSNFYLLIFLIVKCVCKNYAFQHVDDASYDIWYHLEEKLLKFGNGMRRVVNKSA